ncbi:MAG: phospholipid carrier-dependent glycosyltransferase [Rhizobiaceae bacterium]|nr:MAG: phospholipid carrier-dependent glycosyltransferase [Rhizobiaceae bacterium]CAG0957624.1 hypothetical protein RHIZO_00529 [Rhizobiaceae bacterium]
MWKAFAPSGGRNRYVGTAVRAFMVKPGVMPVILCACLIAGLLPYSVRLVSIYPDERHYFDGGAIMLEDGDWLTPRTGLGETRLKKPPLSYWIVAAGMKTFGIGVAGGRVPWIAISAAIVMLTWFLARTINTGPPAALLATALLAGNVVYVRSSMAAIPDLPLTLFVLVATIGFAGLLFRDDRLTMYGWMAYGGISLAVLTKGLLPLALLFWSVAFAFLSAEVGKRRQRLIRPAPIVISLFAAASWFAYQAFQDGQALESEFLEDQITTKLVLSFSGSVRSLLASLTGLALPNILCLLALAYAWATLGPRPSIRATGAAGSYLLGWILLVVGIFLFSGSPSQRYSLPALPQTSVLLAVALLSVDGPLVRRFVRVAYRLVLVGATVVMIVLFAAFSSLLPFWQTLLLAAVLVAGAAMIWQLIGQEGTPAMSHAMAMVPCGLCLLAFPPLSALLLPDTGAPLALTLRRENAVPDSTLFVGDDMVGTRIRLHYGRAHPFVQVRTLEGIDPKSYATVVTEEPEVATKLRALGYRQHEVRAGWRNIDIVDFIAAARSGQLAAARDEFGERGYVLIRIQSDQRTTVRPTSPGPSGS